jgi:multidrug efflux pump subunit AcrB
VIGGLVFATLGTLVFVPAVLSAMRYRPPEPLEGVQL